MTEWNSIVRIKTCPAISYKGPTVEQFVCYKKACIFGRLIQPRQYLIQHILLPFKIKCYLKKSSRSFDVQISLSFMRFHALQLSVLFAKKSVHREFRYITNFTQKVNWKISFLCSYLCLYLWNYRIHVGDQNQRAIM